MSTGLIGTAPDQVPTNSLLGNLAFQDSKSLIIDAQTSISTVSSALPTVKPSLNLDFTANSTLDPRISFSRTTSATYYDGVTTAVSEQNLLWYSQDFDNGVWGKLTSTVTPNTAVAPDGSLTADQISISSQYGNVIQTFSSNNGATYIGSLWVQSVSGNTNLHIALSTNGTYLQVSPITVSGTWTRFSFTVSNWNSNYPITFGIQDRNATGQPTVINIWGAQVEQRSFVTTYTPTTSQPITNYIPVLKTASINQPRLDYDPITKQPKGLLIEESRTNLLSYSQDFSNAVWSKNGCSISVSAIAPDGTLSATKLISDTTSTDHGVMCLDNYIWSAGSYTLSCYVKAAGYNYAYVWYDSGAGLGHTLEVNLLNGTTNFTRLDTTNYSNTSSNSTYVGNGWYRVSITSTSNIYRPQLRVYMSSTPWASTMGNFGTSICTGDGYSGIYVWGAQIEAGKFITSYIPTASAQATRNVDAAYMSSSNFTSWYNQTQGTFYTEYQGGLDTTQSGYGRVLGWGMVGLTSSGTFISSNGSSNSIGSYNGYTAISTAGLSNYFWSNPGKASYTYNGINTSISTKSFYNSYTTSSPAAVAYAIDKIRFGANASGDSNILNGYIKKVSYYPVAQSQAVMIGLTQ